MRATLGGTGKRNVVLGDGRVKTIVPLTAPTLERLLVECAEATEAGCDILEWRIDCFERSPGSIDAILEAASRLATATDRPVLATFRTAEEGGARPISPSDYEALLVALARSGSVAAIDVEHSRRPGLTASIAAIARDGGTAVVASHHDFASTPAREEILARLADMAAAGADVAKIACMPVKPEDVLAVLGAALDASETLDVPVIAISMGTLGVISRLAAGCFGSSATFATVGESSAPGQIPLAELRPLLESLARRA